MTIELLTALFIKLSFESLNVFPNTIKLNGFYASLTVGQASSKQDQTDDDDSFLGKLLRPRSSTSGIKNKGVLPITDYANSKISFILYISHIVSLELKSKNLPQIKIINK